MIDFHDKERMKLKQYFKSLDEDGSGDIKIIYNRFHWNRRIRRSIDFVGYR